MRNFDYLDIVSHEDLFKVLVTRVYKYGVNGVCKLPNYTLTATSPSAVVVTSSRVSSIVTMTDKGLSHYKLVMDVLKDCSTAYPEFRQLLAEKIPDTVDLEELYRAIFYAVRSKATEQGSANFMTPNTASLQCGLMRVSITYNQDYHDCVLQAGAVKLPYSKLSEEYTDFLKVVKSSLDHVETPDPWEETDV